MISYMNYSLTQYTDFRSLQLSYSKLKDQNQQLKAKLKRIENLYGETVQQNKSLKQIKNIQLERSRLREQNEQMDRQRKNKQKLTNHDLIQKQSIISMIKTLSQQITNLTTFSDSNSLKQILQSLQQQSIQQSIIKFLGLTVNSMIKLDKNNQELIYKLRQKSANKNKIEQIKVSQQQKYLSKIRQLQNHCDKIQSLRLNLAAQNNFLKQQINQFQIRFNAIQNQKKFTNTNYTQEDISNDQIDDKNFALDFLNFQKQLLKGILNKIISITINQQLNLSMKEIYRSYQDIKQAYRNKLQVQYDLEDLQCIYKRDKKASNNSNLLIQIRKKIQSFRNELKTYNQIFYQKEQQLEIKINEFKMEEAHQNKLRQYNLDLQKKLIQNQKNKIQKSNSSQKVLQHVSTQFKFKNLDNEELMKEVLRKDRQNMQRIFQQTKFKQLKVE